MIDSHAAMVIPIVQRKLRSIWAKTSRVVRSGESGMPARHLRRTVLMTDSHSARLMLKGQRKLRSMRGGTQNSDSMLSWAPT